MQTVLDAQGNELPVWGFDFETYYEDPGEYSLRKMDTVSYVRDERFKAHGCAVVEPDGFSYWVTHKDLPEFFASIDWGKIAFAGQNCLTGDHEALTPTGWKPLSQLDGTDQVMQWDPETQQAEFVNYVPVKTHYSGTLYSWNSLYHQGVYTQDHSWWYATPSVSSYRRSTTDGVVDLGPNNVYIPTAAKSYAANEPVLMTEHEARLLEAVRADGSFDNSSRIRFKFTKERKKERLIQLLDQLEVKYTKKYVTTQETHYWLIRIQDPRLVSLFKIFLGDNKDYNSSVINLPKEAQLAILDELCFWDGAYADEPKNLIRVISAKKEGLEWLQVVAFLNGCSSRLTSVSSNRGYSAAHNDLVLHRLSIHKKERVKLQYKPEESYYEGYVYCVNVPAHAFVVRRNGVVWITGNCAFDAFIMSEAYGKVAAYYIDTMSMSLGMWGPGVRHGLVHIADRLGTEGKVAGALKSVAGIRDLTCDQERGLAYYGIQDIEETMEHFKRLYNEPYSYPRDELHIIDLTIRTFARPLLRVDAAICRAEIEQEKSRFEALMKSDLLKGAELSEGCKSVLESKGIPGLIRSRPCFSELFLSRGVSPPMKPRLDKNKDPIEGEYTEAFAKTDPEFLALQDDARVQDLVAAKLGFSSNQRITRATTFLRVTQDGTKTLPIPLKYCGGRTHRWSANNKENDNDKGNPYNPQNLNSGRDGQGTRLREAILAPKGWKVISCDSGQIECRFSAYLAGEQQLLDDFAAGRDPYSILASNVFKLPVSKTENARYRPIGKEGELSLSFGVGAPKFYGTITTRYGFSRKDFTKTEEDRRFVEGLLDGFLDRNDFAFFIEGEGDNRFVVNRQTKARYELEPFLIAEYTVHYYRGLRTHITQAWEEMKEALWTMCGRGYGPEGELWRDMFWIENERIMSPNDLYMYYRDIHWSQEFKNIVYRFGKEWTKIYHSKLFQNNVQSGARSIVAKQAVEISKELPVVLLVHDEVVALAPEKEAEDAAKWMEEQMSIPPSWCPGIPLIGESKVSDHYAK